LRILDIPADLLKKYIYVASNLLGGNSHSIKGPNLRSSNRISTSLRSSDPGVTLSTEQRGDQTKALAAVKVVYLITGKLVVVVVGRGVGWSLSIYEGWNFNSGNYLFKTDTK